MKHLGLVRLLSFTLLLSSIPLLTRAQNQKARPGTITCEDVSATSRKSDQGHELDVTDTSCKLKYALGVSFNNSKDFTDAYRVLKSYAESCYDTSMAWQVFVDLSGAVQYLNSDKHRFEDFREWLKSILYLNRTDPEWYCQCALTIMGTYQWDAANQGEDYNAAIAISRYLIASGHCPQENARLVKGLDQIRAEQRQYWIDSCNSYNHDTSVFRMDTTVPSIHDLGLDILMGPNNSVRTARSQPSTLPELTISGNPFHEATSVSFELRASRYLSFQVFDLLGRVRQGDFKGKVYSPGSISFEVEGNALPSGVYYARVSSPEGEVRMARIVKE